jgi:hypothetical protein
MPPPPTPPEIPMIGVPVAVVAVEFDAVLPDKVIVVVILLLIVLLLLLLLVSCVKLLLRIGGSPTLESGTYLGELDPLDPNEEAKTDPRVVRAPPAPFGCVRCGGWRMVPGTVLLLLVLLLAPIEDVGNEGGSEFDMETGPEDNIGMVDAPAPVPAPVVAVVPEPRPDTDEGCVLLARISRWKG